MSPLIFEPGRIENPAQQDISMRVLIAEDDPVSCLLLESFLTKWDYQAVLATDGAEAWKILQQEDAPNLAILDWMMPFMNGPQICRELRCRPSRQYAYIILLTGQAQKEDVIEGLEAGADDYLVKPFDKYELKARLRAGARIVKLQQKLLAAQETLREQATHDWLTGAFNRAAILDILQRELARRERENGLLCAIMVDIDHFKSINDTHGHLVGDAVLREVISRVGANIRAYDSIGRYGGEEFLIVAPDCNSITAASLAERLRACIANDPFELGECLIPVTISLGVAICEERTTADSLLRQADDALYRAKHEGRNRVSVMADIGAPVYSPLSQAAG